MATPSEIWTDILKGDVRKDDPLWEEYLDKAAKFDKNMLDELNKIVDVLLVYVGFSCYIYDELASHPIEHRLRFSSLPSLPLSSKPILYFNPIRLLPLMNFSMRSTSSYNQILAMLLSLWAISSQLIPTSMTPTPSPRMHSSTPVYHYASLYR